MTGDRIMKMVLIIVCVVFLAVWTVGCSSSDNFNYGESMLDTQLIGTWKLGAATIEGQRIVCPGTNATSSFSCTSNETLTLKSDGSYEEVLTSTPDNKGFWFAVNSRLMMDDTIADDNPVVYTYVIDGNMLTAKTLSGTLVVEYERQGPPSTFTHQDIVQAYPELSRYNLVDPNLIGSWRYVSIQFFGTSVTCPGDSGIPGISCGADERVNFIDDNTFTETISNTSHDRGFWYAFHGRVFMDDTEFEDADPSAWMYTISGDVLTMKMWGGGYIATLQRVRN